MRTGISFTVSPSRIPPLGPEVAEWLADVLARIADTPQNRLRELLPWNWRHPTGSRRAA